jgi:hypothetical protein
MKQNLELTKESILNEGIEIKLTQSDIIDALVEEKLAQIDLEVEQINEKSNALVEIYNKLEANLIEESKKRVTNKVKGATCLGTYTNRINHYNTNMSINSIRKMEVKSGYTYGADGIKSFKITFNEYRTKVTLTKIINDVEFTATVTDDFELKLTKGFIKAVKDQNQVIEDFLARHNQALSEKDIAKKIKNQFTKEILKTSSKEFKEKLKLGFAVNF